MKDAADKHRKLFKEGRKPQKYRELYPKLWERFLSARSRGHKVNFHWLWTKARVLYKEMTGSDESIKGHVIVRFLHDHKIKMRARQRNKKKPKEAKIEDLKKWHYNYRERCIRTGYGTDFD